MSSRVSVFVLALVVAMTGAAPAEEVVRATDVPTEPQAAPPVWQTGVPAGLFFVHQRIDGHVVGQIGRFDAAGNLLPVQISVYFVQQGQAVLATQADERGWFQAVGLRPDVYSVIALGEAGLMAFSVRVLPYDAGIPDEELFLFGTLIPPADMAFLADVLCGAMELECVPECVPDAACCGGGGGGGFFGGGGGGGGGGGRFPATPHRIHLPDHDEPPVKK